MKLLIPLFALTFFSSTLFADAPSTESQSTMKIEDAAPSTKNKVQTNEDVDDVLTNAKLRAESGSKSRWSVATALSYDGGTVSSPFADKRPNIQGVAGDTAYTDVNGSISGKLNLTSRDSILFGGGVRWITPFSGFQTPKGYNGNAFDVFDPSVNYQRIYKIGGIQSYVQVGPTFYTRSDVTNLGFVGNVGAYNVNAYDLGKSGVTIGLESGVSYGVFKAASAVESDALDEQVDYTIFAYPYVEYKFNDTFNLRAVTFLASFEHNRFEGMFGQWKQDVVIQSFGVGISVTRDIFLYPNIQFVPDQIRADDSNIGVAANINLF